MYNLLSSFYSSIWYLNDCPCSFSICVTCSYCKTVFFVWRRRRWGLQSVSVSVKLLLWSRMSWEVPLNVSLVLCLFSIVKWDFIVPYFIRNFSSLRSYLVFVQECFLICFVEHSYILFDVFIKNSVIADLFVGLHELIHFGFCFWVYLVDRLVSLFYVFNILVASYIKLVLKLDHMLSFF